MRVSTDAVPSSRSDQEEKDEARSRWPMRSVRPVAVRRQDFETVGKAIFSQGHETKHFRSSPKVTRHNDTLSRTA
jgi:hypothetical protein